VLQNVSDHKRSIIRKPYIALGLNNKNGSILSVDTDVVGVIALPSYTVNYTHAPRAEYAAITPTTSMSTDKIEPYLLFKPSAI